MDIDPANDGDGVPIPPSTTAIPSSKNPTSTRQQQQQQTLNNEALLYGRELQREFKDDPRREVKEALEETFALIAYPDARESSLGFLLEEEGRVPVAEELNGAILGEFFFSALFYLGGNGDRGGDVGMLTNATKYH